MKQIRLLAKGVSLLLVATCLCLTGCNQSVQQDENSNLAIIATPSTSIGYGNWGMAMNDSLTPTDSLPFRRPKGRRPGYSYAAMGGYECPQPVTPPDRLFCGLLRPQALPSAYSLQYWNGEAFVPVEHPEGLDWKVAFQHHHFCPVRYDALRIAVDQLYQWP
jgi:hypothetical protein